MLPAPQVLAGLCSKWIPASFTLLLTVRGWQTRPHSTGNRPDPTATKANSNNNNRLLNTQLWRTVNWRWLFKSLTRGRLQSVGSSGPVFRAGSTETTASCRIHTRAIISSSNSLIKPHSRHPPGIISRHSRIFLSPCPRYRLGRSKARETHNSSST